MPQDRLLHPKAGHSDKVSLLTDLEYRVWTQYLLSADDFGVMRCSAVTLQADNDALHGRPAKVVQRAIDHLIVVKLIDVFEHQGRRYGFQDDWQEFQKVEYPRATIEPKPTAEALQRCSEPTRHLFDQHPGGKGRRKPKPDPTDSELVSQTFSEQIPTTRAHPRETANANANANANGKRQTLQAPAAVMVDEAFERRVREFSERYPGIYRKVRNGAYYHVKAARDFDPLCQLVQHYGDSGSSDSRLDLMLDVFLRMDTREANNVPGTPGQFLHMAPEVDRRLREHGK